MKQQNNITNKLEIAILDLAQNDIDFLDSLLADDGYDLNVINSVVEKNFKRSSFIVKGMLSRQNDLNMLDRAAEFLKDSILKHKEKPINYLKGLVENNQFSIQYRNLEQLDIDEIKQIIKDQDLLDILEKMDDDK